MLDYLALKYLLKKMLKTKFKLFFLFLLILTFTFRFISPSPVKAWSSWTPINEQYFGDENENVPVSFERYFGYLYVGTGNADTGGQV